MSRTGQTVPAAPHALSDRARRLLDRAALPPAVILGTDVTGLTEARALARHGVPVIGVDRAARRYTSYSSAWTDLFVTPNFHSAELIDDLLALARALPRKPSLYVSTDEQVKLIAHHGAVLREAYLFDFPATEAVDLLMSKARFTRLATERGWPIPPTVYVANEAELDAAELRFPVVIKPQVRHAETRRGVVQKAFRCADRAALRDAYRSFARFEPEVVVQAWIPGSDAAIEFSFHYLTSDLRELGSFEGRKLRQWVPEVGSTSYAEPVREERVTDLSREILRATGCVGFGSVEYKRDAGDGRALITEPTVGRVNLQLGAAIANGVDLVSRAYFHLHRLPAPPERKRTFDRRWIWFGNDLKSARHSMRRGELSVWSYLWSLRGPKQYAVWRAGDVRMHRVAALDWAARIPRAILRRLRGLRPSGD